MPATPTDEFALIARLTAHLPTYEDVVIGPGDDAAVVRWPHARDLVVTCDTQVEGRHFLPTAASPEELGARAIAVNVSDLAAMGAQPRFALTSLLLNPSTSTEWIERYYTGLRAAADAHEVAIIGGNISGTSGPFTADITLFGQIEPGRAVLRSGAREGDGIIITGAVGAAAAGLLAATHPRAAAHVSAEALAGVREAWLRPVPRVSIGRALAEAGCASAMIDISDGLAADLGHILSESHAGAILEASALPIAAATREVARALGRDPLDLALYGGDDYELLFTVPAGSVDSAIALVAAHGVAATCVGWIQHQRDGFLLHAEDGATRGIEPRGWDHLRPETAATSTSGNVADESAPAPARDEP